MKQRQQLAKGFIEAALRGGYLNRGNTSIHDGNPEECLLAKAFTLADKVLEDGHEQ